MKTIYGLALGAVVVGCHLDKLIGGSGGPHPTSSAPPAALVFMAQPKSAQVGQKITPVQVSVVDSAGVPVAGVDTTTVVVTWGANPGQAKLLGDTTARPTNGVATFGNIAVDKPDSGYTLIARAPGLRLPDKTSVTFNIMPPPSTTGDLTVTTSTTGLDLDLDGYTVTLDGNTSQSIGSNSSTGVTFPGVPAGSHSVVLSGVAPNCSVSGGITHPVTVPAGGTVTEPFSVSCTAIPPTTGSLTVATSTSGADLDPDGYALTVDGNPQSIAINTIDTLTDLSAGNHIVALSGIAANCSLSGTASRTILVTAGQTASTTFTVTCTPLPPTTGDLVVTTTTGGSDLDPDGYTVSAGGSSKPIPTNGTVTFPGLQAGTQSVGLSGIASNCTVTNSNPMSVNVPAGGTGRADFAISCVAQPPPPDHPPVVNAGGNRTVLFGAVTLNASFTDPDNDAPWSYSIDWDDGSAPETGTATSQGSISRSHSYGLNLLGDHIVRVTVTDSHGMSGSDTADIKVVVSLAPPRLP
jgi:hypothetical protein